MIPMVRRVKIAELVELTPKEANFVIEYTKDFEARRAAVASGYAPDTGYQLRDRPQIAAAVDRVLLGRLENSHIDAEWLLYELVDNHTIARQNGNITASNTALNLIGKHLAVDAFAREKLDVNVNTTKEVLDRLLRGRKRAAGDDLTDTPADDPVSFL